MKFGRFFEDFNVGDIIRQPLGKTITESDNNLFCLLTMNHHPLHLDDGFAQNTKFGKRVVVGTYVSSLVIGLTVGDISGKAIANLEFNVKHLKPVFIGDTIRCETEILKKRVTKTRNTVGIIFVRTKAFNQSDDCILIIDRTVMVPLKVLGE